MMKKLRELRKHVSLTALLLVLAVFALGTIVGMEIHDRLAWAQARALELAGANPFLRFRGTEASGRVWEIRESAGIMTLVNTTSNIANLTLGNAPVGAIGMYTFTYSTLGTAGAGTNGSIAYCSDCTIASPCNSGGTGALAKGLNSTWVCN